MNEQKDNQIIASAETVQNDEALGLLVLKCVFRAQNRPIISSYGFPCFFVFSNKELSLVPDVFLDDQVIRLAEMTRRRFVQVIDIEKLEKVGLFVSYEEDGLLRSVQPVLHPFEATIRNSDGTFAKTVPDSTYDTITLTDKEPESIQTLPFTQEEEQFVQADSTYQTLITFQTTKTTGNAEGYKRDLIIGRRIKSLYMAKFIDLARLKYQQATTANLPK